MMVFFEKLSPSRSVVESPVDGVASVGDHTPPPGMRIDTGWSMKVNSGEKPCTKAAPYTKGLKVEPGWRRACATWSNCSCAKSRLPTHASTRPLRGSSARKPACSSCRSSPLRRRASASGCSAAICFATAWLATLCMRELSVVRTTSPSE